MTKYYYFLPHNGLYISFSKLIIDDEEKNIVWFKENGTNSFAHYDKNKMQLKMKSIIHLKNSEYATVYYELIEK